MGKFTAIQTYSRFLSLWNENKINRNSLTFILNTGLLYTHGIFLNSVAYGTEANGAIDITIAGTSKSLSLSSHTHSNYLEKNKNIDIGTYKIVSGDKDLLYYNAGNTYLGNLTSPIYLVGAEGKIVKGSTTYTLLDTENFSILSQTANGIILSNSALFKYANKTFSIDYIKRYNSTSNFDSLNSVTSAGTTTVNGKKYGFMTFYEEGATSPSWSLIRIDVTDRKLEFRTSSNPTTWVSPAAASIPENTATVAGIVSAPGANNSGKVWKTDASGTPAWRNEVSNTWRNIRINDEETDSLTTGTGTGALYIKLGSGITVAWQGSKIVISNSSPNIWKAANINQEGYVPKSVANKILRTNTDGTLYWGDDVNTTYTFSNLLFLLTSGTNLMTYNSQATKTILAGSNITFTYNNDVLTITAKDTTYNIATNTTAGLVKTGAAVTDITGMTAVHIKDGIIYYKDTNTTYEIVSKTKAGLVPQLPDETTTTKYLRLDGTWVAPPNTWNLGSSSLAGYVPLATKNYFLHCNNSTGALEWVANPNTNTWRGIYVGGTSKVGTGTNTLPINFVAGSNVTITYEAAGTSSGLSGNTSYFNVKIASTNTWTAWKGATSESNGTAGYLGAPGTENVSKFLKGNGEWSDPYFAIEKLTDWATTTTTTASNIAFTKVWWKIAPTSSNKVYGIGIHPTNGLLYYIYNNEGTYTATAYSANTGNTWRNVYTNGTSRVGTSTGTKAINFVQGNNVTITYQAAGTSSGLSGSADYFDIKIDAVNTWTPWKGATTSSAGTAGYMPAPTSAQRGQFLRGDGSWVSLNNYSLPTASNTTLGGVKTGEAITDTAGYTAVTIKDGVIYYKDTTYSFYKLLFLQTSGTNLMTYNSQATRTVLAGSNITFTHNDNILTIAAKDTTYSTVSKTAAGLCPILPNETTTTKYLRLDGTWVTPPNTWKAANTSQEGYAPKLTTGSGTIETQSTEYVLTFKSGTDSAPVWKLLPANAFNNTWTDFTGATASSAGTKGVIQAPKGAQNKFFRGDNTWLTISLNVTSALYVGASNGTGNSAQSTNGNVYLIFAEGSSYSRHKIAGSGRASVTSDADGNITINSSGYSNFGVATASAAGTAGLVPAPGENVLGSAGYYLRADGTWLKPPNTWKAANASQEGYVPKSTANKILRADGDGVLYWGDDTNTTYTFYNLLFQNSGGTTVDTYKPTTSPTKTLKAGSNVTISATSNVITIASTNTWHANSVGVAGYVAAPTKADNANMVWKTDSDGNPAWRTDSNTHYYLTLNGTVKGTASSTNLGTIWAPTSKGTGFLKCNDGTWSYDNTIYATPDTKTTLSRASGNLTKDTWSDVGTFADTVAEGTWVMSFTIDGSLYSGVFSRKKNDTMNEEIDLHAAGTSTRRIYARTTGNKIQIATSDATFNPGAVTFNFRKLI